MSEAIPSSHSFLNMVMRYIWGFVYVILFRYSPKFLYGWRRFLLKIFGANIGQGVVVHNTARIWAPWNLELADYVAIGPDVDLYSVGKIKIGKFSVVSQRSFLCGATHDYRKLRLPLISKSIVIGQYVWVCAEAMICPGVVVGNYAVVQARSFVKSNISENTVVGGHPAVFVKKRIIESVPNA